MKQPSRTQDFPIRLSIHAGLTESLLVDFLRLEILRTDRRRAVIGVSGGIDSAVVLALAVRALGSESVLGAVLPYRASHSSGTRDAERVLDLFGVRRVEKDISPMVDAYFSSCPAADRLRRGNKMARERMSILYDLSASERALVLGTSNKTELLLGYGTLHGDLACALNPLGDLYKTQVRQLARHLGLPSRVLRKAPSAGFYPGQTDETEIGFSYSRLDRLLYLLVDLRGPQKVAVRAGFPRKMVRQVTEMIRRSQYKRRMPLIAKVSQRTIGVDFRYPRDWGT
ncbi:MAG: NAD+ synthase [Acidobacteria bacterium]|nr:NAD+ synthase [Acidobacteriota bacterium]